MWSSERVRQEVRDQIARTKAFTNSHGITPDTLASCCVDPYPVTVDPDDLESRPREMWVAFKEPRADGLLVALDTLDGSWVVVEKTPRGFIAVVSERTLWGALNGM